MKGKHAKTDTKLYVVLYGPENNVCELLGVYSNIGLMIKEKERHMNHPDHSYYHYRTIPTTKR